MRLYKTLGIILFTLFSIALMSQDRAPSPSCSTTQKVGLTDITVEYSRPGAKGRTIFADDGLVPFGKMWRTGANAATKITFSDDVKVADQELAAGSYALLTVPGATTWTVNFYPYDGTRWSSYREATPTVSVSVASSTMDTNIESFVIHFDQLRDYSASLVLAWENTVVPIGISVK